VSEWKRIMKTTAPLISLMMFVEVAAGGLLNSMESVFIMLPAILAIVPGVNALAGNVGSIVGSRISSGLHLGSIDPSPLHPEVRENMEMSFLVGLLERAITATALYFILPYLSIEVKMSFIHWLTIVLLAQAVALAVVIPMAVVVSVLAFRKGLSPNDFAIPVVSTVGDFMGILSLAIAITVVGIA